MTTSPLTTPPAVAPGQRRRGPLTATQRQLWALDRRAGNPAAVNLSYALAIDGPLDTTALAGAFDDLVRSHEPLRTTYPVYDGAPVAEVADEDLARRALRLAPAQDTDATGAALLARQQRDRGFDLARQAPIRAVLLRLAEQRHVLLLTLHHIAADGWSLHLVSRQLSRAYAARLRGEPRAPVAHRAECLDHARWQQAWLRGPDAAGQVRWWVDQLRGATTRPSMLDSPTAPDRSRPGPDAELHRQVVALPDPLAAQLRALGRQASVSTFVLLLTAFQALIQRWSGCAEAVIGTLAANRPTAHSTDVLGAHYNTLLLNTGLGTDPSLAECLLRTGTRTMAALDRQALPYPVLAEALQRQLGWPPAQVPGVMLLMDQYPLAGLALPGCRVTGLYLDDGEPSTPDSDGGPLGSVPAATTADLTFFVREVGQRLTLSVLYRAGALDHGEVAGALGGYLEILAALCDTPELPLSDLELSWSDARRGPTPPGRGTGRPALREVTHLAPVEALSPVGCWTEDPLDGR